jgi:hypothetical protein
MDAERIGSWGFVVAIHLLFAWMVTRPSPVVEPGDTAMTLVSIALPPPALERRRASRARRASTRRPTGARLVRQTGIASDKTPGLDARATPLQATTADDRWDAPPGTGKADPVRIADDNPMHRVNPIRLGPPERFHMRRRAPADIVRAVSAFLFWPPGYTDDPCPGLGKAVETLSGASTERERRILEDAVKQQQRYCM